MDPLGQGVCLEGEKVTFIPKTLPGESGTAFIEGAKGKKVQFAQLKELSQRSEKRIEPECPHFEKCQGCHFLHTDYQTEIELKKSAYAFLFKNYATTEEITYHDAPERLGYRNRIQLHYDLNENQLGFVTKEGILPVPHCRIGMGPIQNKLKELYENDSWKSLLSRRSPPEGHIELSMTTGNLEVHINERYSKGGFRQVYQDVAKLAVNQITEFLTQDIATVDLFGGQGFLSEKISGRQLILDHGLERLDQGKRSFRQFNVYDKFAPDRFSKLFSSLVEDSKDYQGQWQLIIDPPRSGFKNIDTFFKLREFKNCQKVAYLSCHPAGQVRDIDTLSKLGKWNVDQIHFFDFFPSTHHLESLVLLSRK